MGCKHCDHPGGRKTYENQVGMPIQGRVECIDFCIHRIVAALNAGGVIPRSAAAGTEDCLDGSISRTDG